MIRYVSYCHEENISEIGISAALNANSMGTKTFFMSGPDSEIYLALSRETIAVDRTAVEMLIDTFRPQAECGKVLEATNSTAMLLDDMRQQRIANVTEIIFPGSARGRTPRKTADYDALAAQTRAAGDPTNTARHAELNQGEAISSSTDSDRY